MTRKQFIKIIFTAVFIPVIYFWNSIVKKKVQNDSQKNPIILKNDFPIGVTFHNSVIINNTGNELKIFSSRCSHLGCRINSIDNSQIVCPCHGSRYSFSGEVLKGPSLKPLTKLEYKIDSQNGNVIIYPA